MRLGEIKQKIDRVIVPGQNILAIDSVPLYGDQAQNIANYGILIEAIEVLVDLDWHDVEPIELEAITKEFGIAETMTLPLADFNKLTAIVGRLNVKLPVYYSILETAVSKQEEFTINIKLPSEIQSLEELSEFNKKLETLLKSFKLGDFKFRGFDRGSCWYEVLLTGALFHSYFISCLQVAQQYFKTKTAYFESAEAEINYQAAKQSSKDLTKETFQENYLAAFLEAKVREVCAEIKESYGKTQEENVSGLIIATKKLVESLGDGTEFHLSFNPPKYADERAGMLIIDYKKIEAVKKKNLPEKTQAQLSSPSDV